MDDLSGCNPDGNYAKRCRSQIVASMAVCRYVWQRSYSGIIRKNYTLSVSFKAAGQFEGYKGSFTLADFSNAGSGCVMHIFRNILLYSAEDIYLSGSEHPVGHRDFRCLGIPACDYSDNRGHRYWHRFVTHRSFGKKGQNGSNLDLRCNTG